VRVARVVTDGGRYVIVRGGADEMITSIDRT